MDIVTLDPASLKQWQEEDLEHLRYEYALTADDYVIDIGAYRGEWGNEIIKRYGCRIESFEALDNRAAWLYDGEINLGGAYYYSSEFADGPKTTYRCYDIAPYVQREVALMKINIEGSEVNLLLYLISKGLMKNINHLQVQFHLIEGVDTLTPYKIIAGYLSQTHKIDWRYPFCWESWSRKSLC